MNASGCFLWSALTVIALLAQAFSIVISMRMFASIDDQILFLRSLIVLCGTTGWTYLFLLKSLESLHQVILMTLTDADIFLEVRHQHVCIGIWSKFVFHLDAQLRETLEEKI